MPLQKQLIDIPLSLGLDQKKDIRSLDTQGSIQMTNCVCQKTGAVRKRFGHTALSNIAFQNGKVAQIVGGTLFSSSGSLCMIGGNVGAAGGVQTVPYALTSYSEALGIWNTSGKVPEADVLDRQGLATFTGNPTDFDVVQGTNGVVLLVALVDNTMQWAAYDGSSTVPTYAAVNAISPHLLTFTSGGIAPRLIACGNAGILVYVVSATVVNCLSIDLTNPSAGWSAPVALTLSGGQAASLAAGIYDVSTVDGDPTRFCMVYEKAAGNSVSLAIYSSTSPFTQSRLVNFETQASFNTFASMCVQAKNAGRFWVGYVPTAGTGVVAVAGVPRIGFWNETGPVTGTQVSLGISFPTGTVIGKCSTCVTSSAFPNGQSFVFGTGYASNAVGAMSNAFLIGALAQDTAGTTSILSSFRQYGLQLAARLVYEDRVDLSEVAFVVPVYTPSAVQGTHYTAMIDTQGLLRPLATLTPRLSKNIAQHFLGGGNTNLPRNFNIPAPIGSGDVYAFPMVYSTETFHQTIALQSIELVPVKVPFASDRGSSGTLLASAMPFIFDGQYIVEPNFLMYPEIGTVTPSAVGGLMLAGTYQYIAVWEAYDTNGNLHQSATSIAVTAVVTGTTGSVSLVIPCPALSYRIDQSLLIFANFNAAASVPPARAVLYRTTAGGTLFYRVSTDPAPTANVVATGGPPITLTDTLSDTALTAPATAELLYTTGGVLDHFNPPASRCIVFHDGRWFLAGCDEPSQVWPSDSVISGVMPGWNEAISFLATGAVRALASMDDKLILFVQRGTEYGIEYVTGQGPNNIGTQSDWTPPQRIPTDSGALDQRGTCSVPAGILYRSGVGGPFGTGGIFLLGRDLSTTYISGTVEDLLALYPVVTSMVLHPNNGRVYITCVQNDYANPLVGIRLVWDYIVQRWSSDTLSDPDTGQVSVAGARSACVAQTPSGLTYHWLTAKGRVYRETLGSGAASYLDAGAYVSMTYQSAWLKPQMGGFARFWGMQLRGDSFEAHDFSMRLTYDYAPSSYYSEMHTWTAPQIAAFDRAPLVTVQMTPGNQKAEAIQVTLIDATPTGGGVVTGQGPNWASVVLELGVKDGAYRNVPPNQRA